MQLPFIESLQAFLVIWQLLPAPIRLFANVVLIVGLAVGVIKIFLKFT